MPSKTFAVSISFFLTEHTHQATLAPSSRRPLSYQSPYVILMWDSLSILLCQLCATLWCCPNSQEPSQQCQLVPVKGQARNSPGRHPALSQQTCWDLSAGEVPVGALGGIVWPWIILPCCHRAHQLVPRNEQVPIALRKICPISSV